MAVKAELSADRERGPGHGRLRISGLGGARRFDFAVMQNQGTEPYLGRGAAWQATEAWHTVTDAEVVGDEVVVALGPEIVDPIVNRGVSVAYRLVVAIDSARDQGTLRIARGLLGSGAAAAEARAAGSPDGPAAPPPPREEPVAMPPPGPIVVDPLPPEPAPGRRRGGRLVAAALALLALGGTLAGAWRACLIPGFGAASCTGGAPSAATAGDTAAGDTAAAANAAKRSCDGLDAAACFAVAQAALGDHELETARQLLQQAEQMGSVAADIALARMYDPSSWSATTSPISQADWETATYWYETAARKDDVAGKTGAGRLLCENGSSDFERKRGLAYLRAAAAAGGQDVQALISACEAKGAS